MGTKWTAPADWSDPSFWLPKIPHTAADAHESIAIDVAPFKIGLEHVPHASKRAETPDVFAGEPYDSIAAGGGDYWFYDLRVGDEIVRKPHGWHPTRNAVADSLAHYFKFFGKVPADKAIQDKIAAQ